MDSRGAVTLCASRMSSARSLCAIRALLFELLTLHHTARKPNPITPTSTPLHPPSTRPQQHSLLAVASYPFQQLGVRNLAPYSRTANCPSICAIIEGSFPYVSETLKSQDQPHDPPLSQTNGRGAPRPRQRLAISGVLGSEST